MKTQFLKPVVFAAIAAGILSSCVKDDDYGVPVADCTETNLVKTIEVADVPASAEVTQYTQDDVIEAYVVSSDQGGNFFKSISFQTLDGSRAFSVPTELQSSFVSYPPGSRVLIKLKDAYTDVYNGGVRIGSIYVSGGEAAVGRVPVAQIKGMVNRACSPTPVSEEPLVLHPTLEQAKSDFYINKLIELDNVQFTMAAVGDHYYEATNDIGSATNHLVEDAFGNTVIFRTSAYATYKGQIVPEGSGKIRGIMTRYGSDYQFMARTTADVKLTNPRLAGAFYTEDFQEAVDNTNLNIAGWVNFAEAGTKLWKEEAFSGNGYAELSSFGSGNASNIAWLVSPAIDFTGFTTKTLTFKVAQHHLDVDGPQNALHVMVSTDFDGTNVLAATWTEVPANLPTTQTAWYAFLNSVVDLSAYSGTVHVAFKFVGSGTNTAYDGAFQVDDLKAYGQP
ncbi:MAG: DUF5017 domain-containing protein [Flavobacterium sp.]|uniref:DUF5689 domain-containing protein n=1 Tax=Flavobacterium sp. TaxID=239 RepID=UPI001222AD86|nr:DUF5689 domain-containing protein [Flavobacterium sp.]RZJ68125.1 MAG: DUF5017 domain-containing protein [Flavobacterium sp.]